MQCSGIGAVRRWEAGAMAVATAAAKPGLWWNRRLQIPRERGAGNGAGYGPRRNDRAGINLRNRQLKWLRRSGACLSLKAERGSRPSGVAPAEEKGGWP